MWWSILLSVVAGLVLIYLVLLGLLWRVHCRHPSTVSMRETLRLLPHLIRLFRRLAADPDLPRGVLIRLSLLLMYLLSPIDLVLDFVPVLGYADDVIIVAIALRSVTRRAGPEALQRHCPGTPQGLQAIRQTHSRLARGAAHRASSTRRAENHPFMPLRELLSGSGGTSFLRD
jgi:uncharacterized membrane protein YkvA (DUF1232 family)